MFNYLVAAMNGRLKNALFGGSMLSTIDGVARLMAAGHVRRASTRGDFLLAERGEAEMSKAWVVAGR